MENCGQGASLLYLPGKGVGERKTRGFYIAGYIVVVSVACVCYLILYMNMCANIRNLPGRSRGHLDSSHWM